ncbi:DUF4221 family protein [Algoriphagus sp. H41]|uniref:DUF4221 family protein n=1 Tax=Algoriphagus oliviformis TaxID=2811231 RepID=A0ABS3BZI9_9BACT|nr:DUF4221 family protein [Algoriphagus oliviformis]MBN7810274.1 DUF4221 family protein [Algoriphagus oliviformis]
MSKINPLFIFFALTLAFSCKQSETTTSPSWSLEPSGERIVLPIDVQTSNVSVGLQYVEADRPLLFNVNPNANSLQIFDLKDQKLEKEIRFEPEGDQGVKLGYFHVQSLDSIFVFPEMSPFVILSDTSATIKKRLRIELPQGYPMIFPHNSYYVSSPAVVGNELFVKVRADGRVTDFTQEKLDTIALLVAVDLETGASRLLPYGFPKDYLSEGLKQLEYSLVYRQGSVVASFMGDHRVFTTSPGSPDWETKDAASGFLDASMPTIAKDVDGRGFNQYFFAKSRYESLVYDPFRKVYYRFAFPTVEVESDEQLMALRSAPDAFVVMVLDEELRVLTERRFDGSTYLPSNFFVGEKGLHLSINHPDNPGNMEDSLAFELIKLEGN